MSQIEEQSLRYLLDRSAGIQWKPFLGALAEELGAQMPATELRAFFKAIGGRIATSYPLAADVTLGDAEAAINAWLATHGWGWARIIETAEGLEIFQACAPQRSAFGDTALAWSAGLMEGLFAEWMRQLGAGSELVLTQIGAGGACDSLQFRLGQAGATG